MKKKYIALILMLSLLNANKTYAACTQEQINEFERIKEQYKITYEFNNSRKDYTITFQIPYPDKYGYLIDENINIEGNVTGTDTSFTVSGVSSGQYIFDVIGIEEGCDDTLKNITLKLPRYNAYSEDPLCQGIEEFVLCQPTYEKEIDRDTFISRVNTYKKTKENKIEQQPVEENEEKNGVIEKTIEYIKENLLQVIIVAVFIVLVIITTIVSINSIRKSRRLE